MNKQKISAAFRAGHITHAEGDFVLACIESLKQFRKSRNAAILRSALYDAIEVRPGEWRPYTLEQIASRFGLTRECVRQIINSTDSYPHILALRADRQRLYEEAVATSRLRAWRERAHVIYQRGSRRGKTRPEYTAYRAMLQRCHNPNNPNYPRYGGRGITVCLEWLGVDGYQRFFRDMGPRPRHRHKSGRALYSLNRVDNAPIYSPQTCEWATSRRQCDEGQRQRPSRTGNDSSRSNTEMGQTDGTNTKVKT